MPIDPLELYRLREKVKDHRSLSLPEQRWVLWEVLGSYEAFRAEIEDLSWGWLTIGACCDAVTAHHGEVLSDLLERYPATLRVRDVEQFVRQPKRRQK